jgi:signal transduction histidine kinase
VQQLQTGARSFVWNLRDSSLATQPLAEAIRTAVASSAAGHQLEIHAIGETRRLPESIGHELLRVAQEACTNAVKHGAARKVAITLDFTTPARICLRVVDDGRGFDAAIPVPAGHFGLIGIRERVQKLGGEFHLQSEPNKGATITVTVPAP